MCSAVSCPAGQQLIAESDTTEQGTTPEATCCEASNYSIDDSGYCIPDFTQTSNNIGIYQDISVQEANQRCDADQTCSGFTVRLSDNKIVLKNSITSVQPMAGYECHSKPEDLSAEAEAVCHVPQLKTGYAADSFPDALPVADNAEIPGSPVHCDDNYHSAESGIKYTCDSNGGEYSLSGCEADQCTPPSNKTGYNITETSLEKHNFNVSVSCKDGYGPSASGDSARASQCSNHNSPYSLTGCEHKIGFCSGNDVSSKNYACPSNYTIKSDSDRTLGNTTKLCCDKTGFCSGNDVPSKNYDCPSNYTIKSNSDKIPGNTTELCCDKTGFCKGNEDAKNNVPCRGLFYTEKEEKDDEPIPGQDFNSCCEERWWLRLIVLIVCEVVVLVFFVNRYDNQMKQQSKLLYILFFVAAISSGISVWLYTFSDSIPRWLIHRNEGKWIVADSEGGWWWGDWGPILADFATGFFTTAWVVSLLIMYYQAKPVVGGAILILLVIFILVLLNLTGK